MSEPGLNKMAVGDTTYTKIFVGGLAWETKRDTLKRYFEQFGEILEAVVINDKSTGKSKGYGFVTFKDADSAIRACYNPFPVIDGRKANCNIAAFGAHKNPPTSASHHGIQPLISPPPPSRVMAPPSTGTPAFYRQLVPQYGLPYSAYGYPGYTHNSYPLNYYNVYGGQHLASQYTTGVYLTYFPLYPQYPKYGALAPSPVAAAPARAEEVKAMVGAASSAQSSAL
ncbi:RNA-binding protein 38 [Gossypium australe]|uniref:RNA-binding protein 38 n=1 Tax=Gossypium australe TaxID=47621 RepID=A0A5B6UR23_9ROSI|nr:RNA-binding protein 38 [Gossypium australe]